MERRELFSFLSSSIKGEKRENNLPITRPPYYKDIDAFGRECQDCDGLCATSCQEHIITISKDKTPVIEFNSGGCTYCDECAISCERDVLNVEDKRLLDLDISINQTTCLSWQGVMCFSCKDPCFDDAIEFKAMFMPTIDMQKCTSCGFCIAKCPAFAIETKPKEKDEITNNDSSI